MSNQRAYPRPRHYFASSGLDRPIFQGDIFRGGFGAFWRHPDAVAARMAAKPVPTELHHPRVEQLLANVAIAGHGYCMLLPHPCEYSEEQKGAKHLFRVVAPLIPLNDKAPINPALVRDGSVRHSIFVPGWPNGPKDDYYVDLRYTASIDAAFITRHCRVAALSRVSWVVLLDRLSQYYLGLPLSTRSLPEETLALHPDSAPPAS